LTPAIDFLDKHKASYIVHRYQHQTDVSSYGKEAADALPVESARIFKTIVVEKQANKSASKQFAVVLVPVSAMVNLKAVATTLDCKKITMADANDVSRTTAYQLGGVSPFGQKTKLPTIVDKSAIRHATIYVSAGKRGLEIEIAPQLLSELCSAQFALVARVD